MQKDAIIIDQEQYNQLNYDIQQKVAEIKMVLQTQIQNNLTNPSNIPVHIYSFNHLKQLQDMILSLPQQLRPKYTKELETLTYRYAQYMLSIEAEIRQTKNGQQKTIANVDNSFLPEQGLVNFQKIFYQVAFQKILAKLQFKKSSDNSKQYLQASSSHFEDIIKEKLVVDSCVGCNSFFYKYHPIQNQINIKAIPVYFGYNISQQLQKLQQAKLIKPPKQHYSINLLEIQKQKNRVNLLKMIKNILNEKGGYLMFGSYRMKILNNNQLLPQLQQNLGNAPGLNKVHFVIGQRLTESHKNKIRSDIAQIIESILPQIQIDNHIQVRFVPVQLSKYNNGYFLNQLFSSKQTQHRYVVLIAVKPTMNQYNIIGLQQSSHQYLENESYDKYPHQQKAHNLYIRKDKSQCEKLMNEDEGIEMFLEGGGQNLKYFEDHRCKYGKQEY